MLILCLFLSLVRCHLSYHCLASYLALKHARIDVSRQNTKVCKIDLIPKNLFSAIQSLFIVIFLLDDVPVLVSVALVNVAVAIAVAMKEAR